ncbi:MAG: hypothetical protein CME61_06785 [Halobacteriovoraceae bacterium]|nr:hypothetical protein [Halobacteriovoraceae bacterium]|tara:strand:+ start:778 stop:1638 length:861 start_codon:yes stop_codon:yes gene_type:complete
MPTKRQISLCLIEEISVREFLESRGISRNRIKKFKLKSSFLDSVKKEISLPIDLLNDQIINPQFFRNDCKLIEETESFVSLHKPHNLHSHPLSYSEWDNCLSYLRSKNKWELLEVNSTNYDRGLLYRLDFGTSGLLIFSKKEKFIQEFRKLPKKKIYLAIVQGRIDANFTFKHFIDFHGEKKRKARTNSSESPNAKIEGRLIHFNEKRQLSLVEINLFEGLRHQIRAQMSSEGFPIYGDVLYGGKSAERIFLHAFKYEFEIEGRKYCFKDKDFTHSSRYFSKENYL